MRTLKTCVVMVLALGFLATSLLSPSTCFGQEETISSSIKVEEKGSGVVPIISVDYSREDLLKSLPFEVLMEAQITMYHENHGRGRRYSIPRSFNKIFLSALRSGIIDPEEKTKVSLSDYVILRVQGIVDDKNLSNVHWWFQFIEKEILIREGIKWKK